MPFSLFSQVAVSWHHLDPVEDSVLGISTVKAYEFLKNKQSKPVVVAVIDNGADINHEDLKGNIWVNEDEIPGNGIDDDKNGYIDDIHGWNFLGNPGGENMKYETLVVTRYYKLLHEKYANKSKKDIAWKERKAFQFYLQVKKEYQRELVQEQNMKGTYALLIERYKEAAAILDDYFKGTNYSQENIDTIQIDSAAIQWAKNVMVWANSMAYNSDKLQKKVNEIDKKLESRLNPDYNKRAEIVGDNPANIKDSIYGNNKVNAKGPYHGTGVAGIIGAEHNNTGVSGIARNVKLMILRVVPNGDERDKDVALAIKYAVRNGADIINCSFAKDYMMHPDFIYSAMREAAQNDVLIIHAAGNESRNTDKKPAYPNGFYEKRKRAPNWMNVGAINKKDNDQLLAYFSNYGRKSVDVFAPGSGLRTTVLNNGYEKLSGTSIASPVAAGVAAVLKSYYPNLTAAQIREIIIESAYQPKTKRFYVPSGKKYKKKLKRISIAGGVVNLYNAVKLAETYYL